MVMAGPESVECPPTDEWVVSLQLRGAYGPRFPGSLLDLDVRVLGSPDRLLAFRLTFVLRPGFSFLSFETGLPVEQGFSGETLTLSGDASGAVLAGGLLGRMRIQFHAEHAGLLRVLRVTQAQLMVAGGWYSVGVVGQGGSCLRDGFVDVLADHARCTALLVYPNRTQLVHWRGVQVEAPVFAMRVDVLGVWNTGRRVQAVGASCVSRTVGVLHVASCQEIVALAAGTGLVLVRFEGLEAMVSVQVLLPADVRARVYPDAAGGVGRLAVSAVLLGQVLDITPFVLGRDVVACRRGGNMSIGQPVLFHGPCGVSSAGPPDGWYLLAGNWTRRGNFRLRAALMGTSVPRAAVLLFRGNRISALEPWESPDSVRMRVEGGWAHLVRLGESPRCVGLYGSLSVPVLPPAPVSLEIRLSHTILVVQQDLLKLVPTKATLLSCLLVLTDGTKVDVSGRLILTVSQGLRSGSGWVETLYEPGPANVTFRLPGVSCATTSVNISVFVSSVVSAELVCPQCPAMLTEREDPLARHWQDRFPSHIPADWFVVRRRLVDGGTHDALEGLDVVGAGLLEEGHVVATQAGLVSVSTAFTPNRVEVPVIRRWTTGWRMLCNRKPCDPAMKLAPERDGAGMAPFRYLTRLEIAMECTLVNGTVFVVEDPPQTRLLVNGRLTPFPEVPLHPGSLEVQVVLLEDWGFALSRATIKCEVHTLRALEVRVPTVLRQLHCARVWERGELSLWAVLSDGSRASVSGTVRTDGTFLRLDRTAAYVEALWPGRGWVNATFGDLHVSKQVVVSMDSLLFTGLALDAIPEQWSAPRLTRLPMHAGLEPRVPFGDSRQLLSKVVRWQVEPEGIVDVLFSGELVLRSDHYEPVLITGVIRSCQGAGPLVFRRSVQVNVVADQPWQVDFGQEGDFGPPLPAVPEGGQLRVPLFLFCASPLTLYRAVVSLPGLRITSCVPGELPLAECVVRGSAVELTGRFQAGRRVGRLRLGALEGTVLVSGLSRLRVSLAEPGNSTYEFTVRLGVEPVRSVVARVNSVVAGFSEAEQVVWQPSVPDRLEVCCDVRAVEAGSVMEHLVPSRFRLQNITLQPGAVALSLTDPRLWVEYDGLLLDYDAGTGVWGVKRFVAGLEDATEILLDYRHPGAQESLHAVLKVTLTEPSELVVLTEEVVLLRIHCSNARFQSKRVSVELLLRDGWTIPVVGADLGNVTVLDPSVAGVSPLADGLLVTGLAVGNTTFRLSAFRLNTIVRVVVLDASVVLKSVRLPDPYVLRGPWGQARALQVSGVLEDGENVSDAGFLVDSATPSSPVTRWQDPGALLPLENTLPGRVYLLVAVVPACAGGPGFVISSRLHVHLQANRLPDVEVEPTVSGFQVNLVAETILAYLIILDIAAPSPSCLPGPDQPRFADCVVESGRVVLAGSYEAYRLGPATLAVVTPMPDRISGYVELFSGLSSTTRVEIVAGRFGDNGSTMPKSLPAVDPASLARSYLTAVARPWDRQAMQEANLTLQLLTGRQRMVDARLYSNEMELSAMFGVTDRFLAPVEDGTRIEVLFHTGRLPPHPNGSRAAEGVRVPATHFVDGWYVVQWAEPIPHLSLRVSYWVSTRTSLGPWEFVVQDPLVTGRPLHDCPRLATDRASFLVLYHIQGSVNWSEAQFACTVGVAPRRVTLSKPDQRDVVTAAVALESFIRIGQANQALHMQVPSSLGRRLLQNSTGIVLADLRYINDTADPPRSCPPGMFYTKNGTFERLPLHAVLGPDCYGMACLDGYLLSNQECVPAPVPSQLLWLSVLIIGAVLLLLTCLFCALCLGRRRPVQGLDCTSESWPDSSHPSEPFEEDNPDFRNIVLGTYLDDYSKDMLDDDLNGVDSPLGRDKCRLTMT